MASVPAPLFASTPMHDSFSELLAPLDCPICLERMVGTDIFGTYCGHFFHKLCIMRWLESYCPQCRKIILRSDLHRAHLDTAGITAHIAELTKRSNELEGQLILARLLLETERAEYRSRTRILEISLRDIQEEDKRKAKIIKDLQSQLSKEKENIGTSTPINQKKNAVRVALKDKPREDNADIAGHKDAKKNAKPNSSPDAPIARRTRSRFRH